MLFYLYVIRHRGGEAAEEVANVSLTQRIALFGKPDIITADTDARFTAGEVLQFCRDPNIDVHPVIQGRHPSSDEQSDSSGGEEGGEGEMGDMEDGIATSDAPSPLPYLSSLHPLRRLMLENIMRMA